MTRPPGQMLLGLLRNLLLGLLRNLLRRLLDDLLSRLLRYFFLGHFTSS